ncbi:MAG: imidazole glycerol-phosphate synthase subunit HisH [Microbacteriaceae bacterium]|nr:imidazole glycerol-phosphate synthase subunit HisH [Microbacteriaceae bacterium]
MSQPSVVVLDYGSGNVHSAAKALEAAGARVQLTADRKAVLAADGLLVPGVGSYSAVMAALNSAGGGDLIDQRLAGSKPVLGICVGMQVLFDRGVERGTETEGLGQWPGVVTELDAPILPHMGWNTVATPDDSILFAGIQRERFYFVHSYAASRWTLETTKPFPEPRLTWAEHGAPFLAAVENGPLSATQFHPEKSGEPGIRLLSNWITSL